MPPSELAADNHGATSAASVTPRPANMIVHISMRGDVPGVDGEWLGEPGSVNAIEAIALAPAGAGPAQANPAPEYQLVYAGGLMTPWTRAGELCGSQGFGLGARGIRFRLSAESASFFDCRYDVAFTDGSQSDDVTSTEVALAPPGAAIAAIRLRITPRSGAGLIVLNDIDDGQPLPWPDLSDQGQPFLRLRLLSPAFSAKTPPIRNADLIPPESWAAMNTSFQRSAFPGRTVTLREVPDATLVGPGVIFDRDFNYVPIADLDPPEADVARWREMARAARDEDIRQIGNVSLLCRTLAPDNYGHLLIEALSKAWVAHTVLGPVVSTFILQASPLAGITREALHVSGIGPAPVAVLDDTPTRCSRLLVLDGLTHHGIYQSPLVHAALQQLAAPITAAPARKLFVSRSGGVRALHNQDAVEAALHARGFTTVDPGQMTLQEQIATFKGAEIVVGALGAALTNIAFCPRGTRVVALTSQSFPDTFFWFLAQHGALQYEEIRGQDVKSGPVSERLWTQGFTLSDADIAYLTVL